MNNFIWQQNQQNLRNVHVDQPICKLSKLKAHNRNCELNILEVDIKPQTIIKYGMP